MASKELTVILKAKDLAKHTLKKTSNCNHYPKKFRFSLVDKMQNKSLEIYECLLEANRTDIKTYKRERLELQTRAITHCDELLYYIELSNSLGLINIKCVGCLGEKKSNNGTQYYQQERVYQIGEYSLCLPANLPGGSYNYITDEKVCAAMRGRNPDRKPGIELEQTLELNNNGTSNCLTNVQKDNLVLEKPSQLGFMDNGTGQHQSNTVYDEKALCPNITTVNGGGTQQIKVVKQYRIRKLTPKECWRLMDFSYEDFEKAEKVNSNTQLYKQAGNSIVVNVLVAILGQLLQGKEDLYKEIS